MGSNGRRSVADGAGVERRRSHQLATHRLRRIAAVMVAALVASVTMLPAEAAPGDGAWQIQLDKVAPEAVVSGVPSSFLLSVQ